MMEIEAKYSPNEVVVLEKGQFLIPGLIDTHTHAPQFPNKGLGYDKTLLEWLNVYTFPLESKYEDENIALKVYTEVVENIELKNNVHNCNNQISVLEIKTLGLEAKIEELTELESKHVQKIEALLNKLEDLEQQLEKCKKDKIEQQTIFEEYDLKQSKILNNYSNKINEQEKIILKLKRVAEASHTHDKIFQ
ncbi:hypothetical protein J6590_014113 [Homalodisca vitripennis]|nr:hypothetical protein J6590_014113 [Homalodisca vitripennis]